MGLFGKLARSLAEQLIQTNSGKSVKVSETGVCLILPSQLQGVVAKTSEGFFFVAKADNFARQGYCIEIDTQAISKASNMPEGSFTARVRVITRDTSIGVWVGSYDVGSWTDGMIFSPRTPNVLEWFSEWSFT